ncbi:MAG: hypothetical protein MUC60_01795 [Oscillatoria sp. Prado101]|jgi:hypothetical protein|nr:hypothetical protein [Oscillatoria sp. Prado101]
MEENYFLQNCSEDSVISCGGNLFNKLSLKERLDLAFTSPYTMKIFSNILRKYAVPDFTDDWFDEGENCEILRVGGKGWQKGKMRIRLTLEFCPDEPAVEDPPASNKPESREPESPLDDIRRMIKEENQ